MKRAFAALTILVLGGSLLAGASVTTFTDLAAWQAVSTGMTNVTFTGIAPEGDYWASTPPVTIDGATFGGGLVYVFNNRSGYGPGEYESFEGSWVTFAPSTSIGLYYDSYLYGSLSPISLRLSTGDVLTPTTVGTDEFFGFTSTTPVTSIVFDNGVRMSSLMYGLDPPPAPLAPIAPVPEPTSLALFGSGLAMAAGLVRRRIRL